MFKVLRKLQVFTILTRNSIVTRRKLFSTENFCRVIVDCIVNNKEEKEKTGPVDKYAKSSCGTH